MIEVPTSHGPFALAHVLRDADVRSVAAIGEELAAIQADATTTRAGQLLNSVAPAVGRIHGLHRVVLAVATRSRRVRLSAGTVAVTAVGAET